MKRKFYIVILLALAPSFVYALGLGKLDLNSALNEPFDARIKVLSPTADELDALHIGLADSEAFARAKIYRPFVLSKLQFALRRSVDDSPDYIRVFSKDPIREPFLNFLVELSWSNGHLFREYTVLLDPPLYDPNARARKLVRATDVPTEIVSPNEVVTIDDPEHKVVYADKFEQYIRPSISPVYTPNVNYKGGEYGPTTGSDTLWSLASAMRPDTSISVNKMMLALLRANPDAFNNQNINGLKRGQILRMPNESEIITLTNAEALAEVLSQHAAWDDIRGNLSSTVTERPEVSSVPESTVSVSDDETAPEEVIEETDPELRLVAAEDTGAATQQVSSVDSGTGENLVLTQESIQALTQENLELNDRLKESENILVDLKRLLSLKDDELAALQKQMEMTEISATVEAEEMIADEEETIDEEEILEVIDTEPASDSAGILLTFNQYLETAKKILLGNPMIGMVVGVLLFLLILVVVLMKFRKDHAETLHFDAVTEEAFPDFGSANLGHTVAEEPDSEVVTDLPSSETVTVLPDSEIEMPAPEELADFDIEEEDKTQFMAPEESPNSEIEPDEDPLQEVNTYLAFEQFDQAEEFVRNAINDNPDDPEFHTKLLEVFYTSGNKKSYEEAAKVLHDKFGESGKHWDMAVAMWQEMSPNRALFEAGKDDDTVVETPVGEFVDVTADEEAGDDGAGLDYDIGGDKASPVSEEDDLLDVTANPLTAEDVLDISSNNSTGAEDLLNITASTEEEDILDVTAAIGLDEIGLEDKTTKLANAEDVLDISGSSTGAEDLLDFTSGDEVSGEGLLDVTAATNFDLDSEEDLLDVTAATSSGSDSSMLLDLEIESETESGVKFDLGDTGEPAISTDDHVEDIDDNVIDFDMESYGSDDIKIVASEPEDTGLEIDLGIPVDVDLKIDQGVPEVKDEPIRLDVEDDGEISLELDMDDKGGIELDLSTDTPPGIDLSMDTSGEEAAQIDASAMDFDLSIDDAPEESTEYEIGLDLETTVVIPKSVVDVDDDDEFQRTMEIPKRVNAVEDNDDTTVFVPRAFVPRATPAEEQSIEDEIATKLDLAKAYVELGDKDSAKTILDEVMAEGNDEQRKQANDLLGQI